MPSQTSHLGRVRPHNPGTENGDVPRRDSGNSGEKDPPAALPVLQEFRAFLARTFGSLENLSRFERLDQEFIRVIEDVIYLLIERRVFLLTDLPEAAQQKLAERRNLRGKEGDLGAIVATGEDLMLP